MTPDAIPRGVVGQGSPRERLQRERSIASRVGRTRLGKGHSGFCRSAPAHGVTFRRNPRLKKGGATRGAHVDKQTDLGLIAACQQGDAAAFRQVFDLNRERVYRLCSHMAGNHQDAEDLAQESFVQAFGRIQTFRGESAFATWLLRMAANCYLRALRKHRAAFVPLDEGLRLPAGSTPEDQLMGRLRAPRRGTSPARRFHPRGPAYAQGAGQKGTGGHRGPAREPAPALGAGCPVVDALPRGGPDRRLLRGGSEDAPAPSPPAGAPPVRLYRRRAVSGDPPRNRAPMRRLPALPHRVRGPPGGVGSGPPGAKRPGAEDPVGGHRRSAPLGCGWRIWP